MGFPSVLERDFDFFDKFFNIQNEVKTSNFPKASIFIDKQDNLVFKFALAGYSKADINITIDDGKLSVAGKKENNPIEAKRVYQNQIAFRDFQVSYRLPLQYVTANCEADADFVDGILSIKIKPKETFATKQITIK